MCYSVSAVVSHASAQLFDLIKEDNSADESSSGFMFSMNESRSV